MMFAKIMKARIEKRTAFWRDRNYQVVESGNGWSIERPSEDSKKEVPKLDVLLAQFFKKKKYKWE